MSRPARSRTRKILLFLGGVVAGMVLLLGLLGLPPIQRWILRRIVATQPGWSFDARRFSAGATGVESSEVVFSMPGLDARAEPLNVRLAPFALLRRRQFHVEEVAARRLRITVRPAELASAPPEPAAPFAGLLGSLRSPLPWALLRTALDGQVTIQEGGQDLAAGEFKLEGGGVTAGKPGEFSYELAADSVLLPPGPANKLRSRGALRIEQDAAHGVGRIVLDGDLTLPAYGDIRLPVGAFRLEVAPDPAGESYRGHVSLGKSTATFAVALDVRKQELSGAVRFEGGQELVAALFPDEDPSVAADGEVRFTTRLATGDTDAEVAGTFVAREWRRYMPELSAVDAFRGRFAATLERRAGALALKTASLRAEGAASPALVTVDLLGPLPLPAWPDRALAKVKAERIPVEWAGPFLEGTDVVVGGAAFDGEWMLHLPPAFDVVRLEPARPAAVAGFSLTGPDLPALPPLTAAFSPRIAYETGPETATVTMDDFVLTGPEGDRLEGAMRFTVPVDETVVMTGDIRGALPTLLGGPERPRDFHVDARWDATLSADGNALDVRAFALGLRGGRSLPAALEVATLQPMRVSLVQVALGAASPDLLRLRFDRLPLDWMSRWLPDGWQLAGELAGGESIVRQETTGEFALRTPTPWGFRGLGVGLGGREVFRGTLDFRPALRTDLKQAIVRLEDFAAEDLRKNRVTGLIAGTMGLSDNALAGEVVLDAALPELPQGAGGFGPLTARLALKARRFEGDLFMAEELALTLRQADRELLALTTPQPLLVGFNDKGAFAIGTLAPLSLRTGEIPLAWLRPWATGYELDGVLEPAEFLLSGEIQNHRLRATRPVRLRDFTFGPAGRPLLRDTTLAIHPGADLQFLLHLLPTFQLAYQLDVHAAHGAVDVGSRRALDLDLSLRALGNDRTILPQRIDLAVRADLGELGRLPGYADAGLPRAGQLVARANGDLLGGSPLEVWTRLEGLTTREGAPLSPVELTARGTVRPSEKEADARFDVRLRVLTSPQESDATFVAALEPDAGTLTIDSSLKSEFLDLRELLRFEEAFAAPPEAATSSPAPVRADASGAGGSIVPADAGAPAGGRPPTKPSGTAFWSVLRGRFDLDVATARFAPYQIDRLRGQLEVGERELTLRGLSGEMFAGRWEGDLRLTHDPAAQDFGHRLEAGFRIEQFESARVVETVFPQDYARVQARIDLDAKFTGRGNELGELIEGATGAFTVEGRGGVVRLSLPHQEMASSLAILGGTVALSPELRALGRLLRKFAEMPVDRIRISGERDAAGEVRLGEFLVDSPQAQLRGRGRIAVVPGEPLMNRPLDLSVGMAARDELAVILGGMKLLERKPGPAGYRAMREPFVVGGKAGEPDLVPLYDLLARGVAGSRGTWGFLMRKVQREVEKARTAAPAAAASGT